MYTIKQLIDKAYRELLDSGLSEKTVYGANWYIWNRLVKTYGENALFKEELCYEYCRSYFERDIYSIDKTKLLQVEKRYITAFNNLIQSSNDIPFTKSTFHYHRDYKLDDYSLNRLDDYLKYSKENGNSEKTLLNKKLRIKNFIIDIDFKNINREKNVGVSFKKKSRTRFNCIQY